MKIVGPKKGGGRIIYIFNLKIKYNNYSHLDARA